MAEDEKVLKKTGTSEDQALMKTILELIDSGSLENKHKALDIIEREDTRLSGYYAMKFFERLNYDTDESIKTRTREIMDKKCGPDTSKHLDESLKKFQAIRDSFKNLAFSANQTSAAVDASQNLAKIMRASLTIPINSIALSSLHQIAEAQQKMIGSLAIAAITPPSVSPFLGSAALFSQIAKVKDPKLTIPQALGKSIPEIERELDDVIESNEDVIFNFEGYKILYNLERFLRDIIKQRICERYPRTIAQKIPPEIIEDWKKRKQTETENPYVSGDYDLMDYSDFNDLKTIIEKRSNKKDFLDVLSDQDFAGLISKLNELDPIRKKIAHSRSLQKTEFDRLKIYAEDINTILNSTTKK